MNCTCESCVGLCRKAPGWFSPHQITPLARSLHLTEKETLERYLKVEVGGLGAAPVAVHALAPKMVNGACVFLKDSLCLIHDRKPIECRLCDHATIPDQNTSLKRALMEEWRHFRRQLQSLVGRKLKEPPAFKRIRAGL